MSRFISDRLAALKSYVPGEQPVETQYIKLNTNESPYPPSPGVIRALNGDEVKRLNLYPNPDGKALIEKIAERYDVLPENVIIGNGSDELLAFAFFAFFESGVVFPDVTYGFYPVYADLYNVPYTKIPLCDDLTVNAKDYIDIGKNIVLSNPNAPTGTELAQSDIINIVRSNPSRLVLVDEAYVDFGAQSVIPMVRELDNLLVIHTFSKARSMAGARLAYAIASKQIIDDLKKMKYSFNPYNVNRLTQIAGIAALEEESYYKEMRQEIIKTRQYASDCLRELGFEMTDSKTNFLFAKSSRIGGERLYLKLKSKGILVRHWNLPRIEDYLRITIGTKEQMDALFAAIREIQREKSRCIGDVPIAPR